MRYIEPEFEVSRLNGELDTVTYQGQHMLTLVKPSQIQDTFSKRCLLMASGPSAKQVDLRLYDNEPVFFMNGSILGLTHERTSDTFFIADDAHFVRNSIDTMSKALELADHLFLSALAVNILCKELPAEIKGKRITIIERINRFHGIDALPDKLFYKEHLDDQELTFSTARLFHNKSYSIGFSKNLNKGYFSARTIPYCAMQVGFHMGAREFHIAGMDLSSGRFYEEKNPLVTTLNDDYSDHILPSFTLAGKLAQKEGWIILNLSKQSRLPNSVIPKA
jgi:KDO transferase-3